MLVLAEHVQLARPRVEVLYMTGHIDQTHIERGGRLVNDRILEKPFSADELLRAVREVLARRPTKQPPV